MTETSVRAWLGGVELETCRRWYIRFLSEEEDASCTSVPHGVEL